LKGLCQKLVRDVCLQHASTPGVEQSLSGIKFGKERCLMQQSQHDQLNELSYHARLDSIVMLQKVARKFVYSRQYPRVKSLADATRRAMAGRDLGQLKGILRMLLAERPRLYRVQAERERRLSVAFLSDADADDDGYGGDDGYGDNGDGGNGGDDSGLQDDDDGGDDDGFFGGGQDLKSKRRRRRTRVQQQEKYSLDECVACCTCFGCRCLLMTPCTSDAVRPVDYPPVVLLDVPAHAGVWVCARCVCACVCV
jgi:hypothetical protein